MNNFYENDCKAATLPSTDADEITIHTDGAVFRVWRIAPGESLVAWASRNAARYYGHWQYDVLTRMRANFEAGVWPPIAIDEV